MVFFKCTHCNERVNHKPYFFFGLKKAKFCEYCWCRLYTGHEDHTFYVAGLNIRWWIKSENEI